MAGLAATVSPSARAQEPPAHFPLCVSDSTARAFLARVGYVLATADSAERARLGLTVGGGGDVALVTEEPLCLAAAGAYARHARGSIAVRPPFPVSVVRADGRYFVQLGGVTGQDVERWEVVVFDQSFRRLSGFCGEVACR